MELEVIKAWDGVTGSGKDTRLMLERNFDKIVAEFESKVDKLTGFVYLGPAEISAMPGVFGLKDRVYYSMLVPKEVTDLPNFGIQEITLTSDTIFFLTWAGEFWSVSVFPLPALSRMPEMLLKADQLWVEAQLEEKANAQAVSQALQNLSTVLEEKANTQALQNLYTALDGKASAQSVSEAIEDLTYLIGGKISRIELQDVTDEQLDLLFSDGEYSINMAGGTTYVPSEFYLKVSTDGNGNIIHTRKTSGNKEFSRVFVTEWGEWTLIAEDLTPYVKHHELINVTTIDDIFDDGNYDVRMQSIPEELSINEFHEFELKVSHFGASKVVIHEQKAGDKTYTRSFNVELPWSPWILIADDLSKMVKSNGTLHGLQICETIEEFDAIDPKDPFTLYFVKTA